MIERLFAWMRDVDPDWSDEQTFFYALLMVFVMALFLE